MCFNNAPPEPAEAPGGVTLSCAIASGVQLESRKYPPTPIIPAQAGIQGGVANGHPPARVCSEFLVVQCDRLTL